MLVTVVTVYRDWQANHFVGVVHGSISEPDRDKLAKQYNCLRATTDEHDEHDIIYFREVETAHSADDLETIWNIDEENNHGDRPRGRES